MVEEIIGRLPELSGTQFGRLEDARRCSRRRRASSAGGGEDAPHHHEGAALPVTEVQEYNPTRTAICIVIVAALTGVIDCFGGPIAVLRKVSDKEYEQRSDCVCSWCTKGEINRKAPLWLPAGLGCMRL